MRLQPKRVPSFSNRPGFPSGLRVLLIDPDTSGRLAVQEMLNQCNYAVTACTSATDAVLQLSKLPNGFDVILAEAKALGPRIKDSTVIKQRASSIPLLLMGLNPCPEEVLLGIKLGAVDFLEKPLSPLKLRNIWQHTVRKMMADMDIKQEGGRRKSADGDAASPTHSSSTGSNTDTHTHTATTHAARMARQQSLLTNASTATAFSLHTPSSQLPSAAALIQASNGLLERVQSCSNASQGSGSSGGSLSSHCDSASTSQQAAGAAAARDAAMRPKRLMVREAAQAPGALPSPPGIATPPAITPPLVPALSPALPPIPPPPMAPLPPGMVWGMPMTTVVYAPGIVPPTLPTPANNVPWAQPAALPLLTPPPQPASSPAQPALPPQLHTAQAATTAAPAAPAPAAAEPAPGSLAADMAAATGCSALPRISSSISDLAVGEDDCSLLFPELDGLLWEEPASGGAAAAAAAAAAAGAASDGDSVLGLKLHKSDSLLDMLSLSLIDGSLDTLLAVESAA